MEGETLTIRVGEGEGKDGVVYTDYAAFAADVQVGERVLLDDGKLALTVKSTNGKDEVVCDIIHGGPLRPRKGLNLPETEVSLPCITPKDAEDLVFALEKDVDWIGLSFVRRAADILELQEEIKKAGKHARVVAKIENGQYRVRFRNNTEHSFAKKDIRRISTEVSRKRKTSSDVVTVGDLRIYP